VWTVVRKQHGVISHAQLIAFDFGPKAIRHRLQTGRLHSLQFRGVYAVGRRELTREGVWMAAVLACGEGAALSHESAAQLLGIRRYERGDIEVSIPAARSVRLEGIRAHRRNPMPATTTLRSIPVTQPLFTLVDLATSLHERRLEAAINEADTLGLLDPETARAKLDAIPRWPGIAKFRRILDSHTRTDSDLERRFLRLVKRAGLPMPVTQARVNGHRVDFYWPHLRLVVETDGLTYHRTPTQQIRDRERDQAHTKAGLTQLRFANVQVRAEPESVAATLKAVAERLRNTPPRGGL
jgi:very-short-patch-repair endonuclease